MSFVQNVCPSGSRFKLKKNSRRARDGVRLGYVAARIQPHDGIRVRNQHSSICKLAKGERGRAGQATCKIRILCIELDVEALHSLAAQRVKDGFAIL